MRTVATLLPLLKKGSKWYWSSETQKAFVTLRNKFAGSIPFVQPDETMPYTINTDASDSDRGGGLMQNNKDGKTTHSIYGITSADTDGTPIFGC
jgi:hypothetical protein